MKMRRSVRSFKPSHLHPNPGNILGRFNFWRLVPSNSRSTLSVQMPHPSAGTDQRCFVKDTISDRDFLVHLFFCAICSRERLRNSFPLNTSISKYMYSARKMTVPVQIIINYSISWKPLRFASWFPTLISCSPNLPSVYIRLCKHGNHFKFLQYTTQVNSSFRARWLAGLDVNIASAILTLNRARSSINLRLIKGFQSCCATLQLQQILKKRVMFFVTSPGSIQLLQLIRPLCLLRLQVCQKILNTILNNALLPMIFLYKTKWGSSGPLLI